MRVRVAVADAGGRERVAVTVAVIVGVGDKPCGERVADALPEPVALAVDEALCVTPLCVPPAVSDGLAPRDSDCVAVSDSSVTDGVLDGDSPAAGDALALAAADAGSVPVTVVDADAPREIEEVGVSDAIAEAESERDGELDAESETVATTLGPAALAVCVHVNVANAEHVVAEQFAGAAAVASAAAAARGKNKPPRTAEMMTAATTPAKMRAYRPRVKCVPGCALLPPGDAAGFRAGAAMGFASSNASSPLPSASAPRPGLAEPTLTSRGVAGTSPRKKPGDAPSFHAV